MTVFNFGDKRQNWVTFCFPNPQIRKLRHFSFMKVKMREKYILKKKQMQLPFSPVFLYKLFRSAFNSFVPYCLLNVI